MQKYDIVEHPSFYAMEMTKDGKYYLVAEVDKQIAVLEAQLRPETPQPELSCKEADGCPVEGVVLRREWRRLSAKNKRLREALRSIELLSWSVEVRKIANEALRGEEMKNEILVPLDLSDAIGLIERQEQKIAALQELSTNLASENKEAAQQIATLKANAEFLSSELERLRSRVVLTPAESHLTLQAALKKGEEG